MENKIDIYTLLNNKLKIVKKEVIIKELKYNSIKSGMVAIDKFINSKDIYNWLHSGFFDFKYNADEFLKQLCNILKCSSTQIEDELKQSSIVNKNIKKYSRNHIFINTKFKRVSEPICVLVFMEHKRYIQINKDIFLKKNDEDILKMVSEIIKHHYIENNGELKLWGKIDSYQYISYEKMVKRVFTFDKDGNLI